MWRQLCVSVFFGEQTNMASSAQPSVSPLQKVGGEAKDVLSRIVLQEQKCWWRLPPSITKRWGCQDKLDRNKEWGFPNLVASRTPGPNLVTSKGKGPSTRLAMVLQDYHLEIFIGGKINLKMITWLGHRSGGRPRWSSVTCSDSPSLLRQCPFRPIIY